MAGVVEDIAEAHGGSPEIERTVERVSLRYTTLTANDDPKPSPQLIRSLQDEVNTRAPVASLFYPTDLATLQQHGAPHV
jgi:hypothetical protein